MFILCDLILVTVGATILSAAQLSAPPIGNYRILSAIIDQYPPEDNNTTINENFAIIAQGTDDGSLPVECGFMWNVSGPTPNENLPCTDPAVNVVVRQMHTSPEYGFDLFVQLNYANLGRWTVGNVSNSTGWTRPVVKRATSSPVVSWVWSGSQII